MKRLGSILCGVFVIGFVVLLGFLWIYYGAGLHHG